MELLPVLLVLWRRRWLVLLGCVASIAVAAWLASRPVGGAGIASTRVLVDTPRSEVVSADPVGSDTLLTRSVILVHSMLLDDAREGIARSLGVSPKLVTVIDPALDSPAMTTTLPVTASGAAAIHSQPFALVLLLDTQTPIISLEGHAPDPAAAAKLVTAGVEQLQKRLPTETGPAYQRVTIQPITRLQGGQVLSSHGRIISVVAAVVLFGAWCVFLVVAALVLRLLRRRTARPAPQAPLAAR